jgi:multidrug efflux pump subunit AcrA (membrane-fusion protein)
MTPMDVPRPRRRKSTRWIVGGAALAIGVAGATFGFRGLRGGARVVDGTTLWTDVVKRGPLVLEVQGTGRLVPEEIRFLSAPVAARVEKVHVRPGARVETDTILVELSNPDVELAALEAERDLAGAEARLTSLSAQLERDRLAQESQIATLETEKSDAARRAKANEKLSQVGVLSELEREQAMERAQELSGRVDLERKRLGALGRGNTAQITAQRSEIERLQAIAQFRRKQVEALSLRAGVPGVVQELSLQVGESVPAGGMVAKVVRPERLKAELRIPETAAKDVQIGQAAIIDLRNGRAGGKVVRIDPAAAGGSVLVDVAFAEGEGLPAGARPDQNIDGTIELARVKDALYVGRPAFGETGGQGTIFRVTSGLAVRVPVKFGRASVKSIEILTGLNEGDAVILSDMSQWQGEDELEVK